RRGQAKDKTEKPSGSADVLCSYEQAVYRHWAILYMFCESGVDTELSSEDFIESNPSAVANAPALDEA
ncbi:MAG: hypothetical protein ACO34C_05980, partial [Candidatus Kapaibacteriota bacterium]